MSKRKKTPNIDEYKPLRKKSSISKFHVFLTDWSWFRLPAAEKYS